MQSPESLAPSNRALCQALGTGKPLAPETRADMETRFGQSFADVRIHDDPQAQANASALQARAYTVGTDIVFGAGHCSPHKGGGRQLLAHELAHVVQQRRGGPAPELSPDAPHEASADRAAAQLAQGASAVTVTGGTAVGIARNAVPGGKPPPQDEPAAEKQVDPQQERANFIRLFRQFRRHDHQFWRWMAHENAVNPGQVFRGLYAWMGPYGFGQTCKVDSSMEDMLDEFDAAVLRWAKATHGRYISQRELTDPFAMAPVYDPEAYERRMNEVILQALPDGRGYMGTRRGFQAAERQQILARQMQTLANVEGSIFGTIGAAIGGDVGSDIGASLGNMFMARAPTVKGKSAPQQARRPDVTLVERAAPRKAETPGGPPKSLVTPQTGAPPVTPPSLPATAKTVAPPVTPPSSAVTAKTVTPPVTPPANPVVTKSTPPAGPPSPATIEARLGALEVPSGKRAAFNVAAKQVRKLAAKDPAAAERMLEGLEDRFGAQPGGGVAEVFKQAQQKFYPEKGADNKYRQSPARDERLLREQGNPSGKDVLKARVRESERLGVMGGQEQAAKEGITVKDWNTPQQWKGEFGKGPDALGERGAKRQMLEFKGGASSLGKSNGVVEMSNKWAGRKIAELEAVGDKATAADLLKAAREGNLQGVVYRTRELKAGVATTRLKSHQLRDHLKDENISQSGLIQYSPSKVERAYQERKQQLDQAIKTGNLRGLKNL